MRMRTQGGPAHDGGAAAAAAAAAGFAGGTPLRFRTPANTPALKAGAAAGASPPGGLFLVSPEGGVTLGGSTPHSSLAAVPEQDSEARACADGADGDGDRSGARRLGDAMEAAAGLASAPGPTAGMVASACGAEDEGPLAAGCPAGAGMAGAGLQTPPCPEGFAEGAGEAVGHAGSGAAEGGAGGGTDNTEAVEDAQELADAREATPPGYVPRRRTTPYMDKKLAALQVFKPPASPVFQKCSPAPAYSCSTICAVIPQPDQLCTLLKSQDPMHLRHRAHKCG